VFPSPGQLIVRNASPLGSIPQTNSLLQSPAGQSHCPLARQVQPTQLGGAAAAGSQPVPVPVPVLEDPDVDPELDEPELELPELEVPEVDDPELLEPVMVPVPGGPPVEEPVSEEDPVAVPGSELVSDPVDELLPEVPGAVPPELELEVEVDDVSPSSVAVPVMVRMSPLSHSISGSVKVTPCFSSPETLGWLPCGV
jgi:hypothetical protein